MVCSRGYYRAGRRNEAVSLMRILATGVCQFVTVPLCLVGWFWSIAWAIRMLQVAGKRDRSSLGLRRGLLQSGEI
ncbi:unnamed protein product [Protopolystoma xenopodis]|uniref:Uncharacterized protein n=1 Tax=Protopolystoma xenopodis TaxID=117903 RepID=A0A448WPN7_9PLAT|nr:unnamed protein product [Protopolystoma xenopodis]